MRIRYWTERASRFDGVSGLDAVAGYRLAPAQGASAEPVLDRETGAGQELPRILVKRGALALNGKAKFGIAFYRSFPGGRDFYELELEGPPKGSAELARIGAELELVWGLRPEPLPGDEAAHAKASRAEGSETKRDGPEGGLGPRSDMAEIGLQAIRATMAGIRRLARKASFDQDAFDSLKSRIRRLRAALWFFGPYFDERPKKLARKAKGLGHRLSALSEIHASLEAAREHALSLDAEGRERLVPFIRHLAEREARMARKMVERIEGGAVKWLLDLCSRFIKLEEGSIRLDRRVRPRLAVHAAPPMLSHLLMRLLAYGEAFESGDDALHRYQEARVRAKRLRLGLELLAPCLGEGAGEQARLLAAMQAELGGIDESLNAAALARGHARRLSERGDEEGAAAIDSFAEAMRARARRIATGFEARWNEFSEPSNITRLIGAIFPPSR
jgi:CHAD domain-containing protein